MQIAKSFRDWQREWDSFDKDGLDKPPSFDEFVEPFLAMEKEQIVNAWDKRIFRGTFVKGWHIETQNGEEYYNETYTKRNE